MTPIADDPNALSALSHQLAGAVEGVGRAVVQVDARARRPSSGTVYAPDLVIAADHAVERDEELRVETADERTLDARLLGRDPATDLAVLRVGGLGLDPARPAGGPGRVGQLAVAVGRPAGRELMASLGMVSAVGGPARTRRGMLEEYLQTDATPYPGFSGGVLADVRGTVLGILTTGLAGGMTLAIPAGLAWRIADTLAREGAVRRGYLGIGSQPVRIPPAQRGGQPTEAGLLIVEVAAESPAERGGLLLGDILVALDGRTVGTAEDLQALLIGERVGRSVPVQVIRGGQLTTLEVMVGQRGRTDPVGR
jgi:S1-C subfamily serine protease